MDAGAPRVVLGTTKVRNSEEYKLGGTDFCLVPMSKAAFFLCIVDRVSSVSEVPILFPYCCTTTRGRAHGT